MNDSHNRLTQILKAVGMLEETLMKQEQYRALSPQYKDGCKQIYTTLMTMSIGPKEAVKIIQAAANCLGQIQADIQIMSVKHGISREQLDKITDNLNEMGKNGIDILGIIEAINKINKEKKDES